MAINTNGSIIVALFGHNNIIHGTDLPEKAKQMQACKSKAREYKVITSVFQGIKYCKSQRTYI